MKLTVGDDLKPVYDLIFRVRRRYPQHLKSINKISRTVDRYITEYRDCLWHYQRKPSPRYLDRAQTQLDNITGLLTQLERAELLAILSGEPTRD